jgi:ElaB/YqjD/DUF883 family membrane-anchored ribosome-binding protein
MTDAPADTPDIEEKTASDIAPPAATPEEKRDALRMKIEASERRIAERTFADQAKEAADGALEYTRQNPLTVAGGALALGLMIGLMTKPGRRVATNAATGAAAAIGAAATRTRRAAEDLGDDAAHLVDQTSTEASRVGNMVSDAIIAFGMKVIDDVSRGAQSGQDALEDIGDSAGARARKLRREAGYVAGSAADKGRNVSRRTKRRAARAARDLSGKVRG